MANKEKKIGNSPLLGTPKSSLELVVRDGSVTLKKLSSEVINLINSHSGSVEPAPVIECIDLAQRMEPDSTVTTSEINSSPIVYDTYNRILEWAVAFDADASEWCLLFKVCYSDGEENYRHYIAYTAQDPDVQDCVWTFSKVITEEDDEYPDVMRIFGDAVAPRTTTIPIIAVNSEMTFRSLVGGTVTKEITATGYGIPGDISVAFAGDGGGNVFSVSHSVVGRSDTTCVVRITVTYAPTEGSQYNTGTITLSAAGATDAVIQLKGFAEGSPADLTRGYIGTSSELPSFIGQGRQFSIGNGVSVSVTSSDLYVWVMVPKGTVRSVTAINSSKDSVTVYDDSEDGLVDNYITYYWTTGFLLNEETVTFTLTT